MPYFTPSRPDAAVNPINIKSKRKLKTRFPKGDYIRYCKIGTSLLADVRHLEKRKRNNGKIGDAAG